MSILFGHPTGNPNSHHAALAHFDAGRLEAFCVPWMPSKLTLSLLEQVKPLRSMAQRLRRRHFAPLAEAPKIQGRAGELRRLLIRGSGWAHEHLSNEANHWLMRTMTNACRRTPVTAVHAYEDCSLWQFTEAKCLGKACIYDMPTGYYAALQETQTAVTTKYVDWLPAGASLSNSEVSEEQKCREMALADIVLVPSSFAERTIKAFHPDKTVFRAAYGVDTKFWAPQEKPQGSRPLRFVYAGRLSLLKGIPQLIEAWEKAALRDAELELIGTWQLAESKRRSFPATILCKPPCSAEALRSLYQAADVFVFPSLFEGFGLVLVEALSCGLPAICSESTAGSDIVTESCGRLVPAGDIDALVESLRWFSHHRERIPALSCAARSKAEYCRWDAYRRRVAEAVAGFS
jgi:glycosyltransferase involved in cell wall biosynthesis